MLELRAGIRLPTPEFCPSQMANIIEQCFLEDPNDRPTFGEIKETIVNASEDLKTVVLVAKDDYNGNEEKQVNEDRVTYIGVKIDDVIDKEMEGKYFDMKERNKNRHNEKALSPRVNEIIKMSMPLLSAASGSAAERYISLENTSVPPPTEFSSNDERVEESMCSTIESINKYKQFSPGSTGEKRFFSYYGIDNIEAQDFVTAQSCNPLYMIDHKVVHSSEFQ